MAPDRNDDSRSRSRSKSKSISKSRSRSRDGTKDRSRSRSRDRGRSRSRSRSSGRHRTKDHETESSSLLIRNIPFDARVGELRDMFGKFGEIKDVYIPKDHYSRRQKGLAVCEFTDHESAKTAIEKLDGYKYAGREITILFAKDRRKQPDEMRSRDNRPRYRGSSRDRDSRRPYRSDDRRRDGNRYRDRRNDRSDSRPRDRDRRRRYVRIQF